MAEMGVDSAPFGHYVTDRSASLARDGDAMTPRTRDPEATRTAILDAAEQVFLAKGFGNAAMSEIAKKAGVTKSLLHHHFGSKMGLWADVKHRRFEHYAKAQIAMLENDERSDASLLRDSMEFYFHFLQKNKELVRILAWIFLEQESEDELCMSMDKQLFQLGTERIRQGQERGEIRSDLNPFFILFTFIGICQHWFQDRAHLTEHLAPDMPEEAVDEMFLRDAVKIFFEGVVPR
jgi:TetR/AcrR family transcriptional regulator